MAASSYPFVPKNESLLLYAIIFQVRPLAFEISNDARSAVVTRIMNPEHRESGLRIGSIITEINDRYVEQMKASQVKKILASARMPLKILFKQELFDITITSKFPIGFVLDADINNNDAIVTNVYDVNLARMGLKLGQYIYKIGANMYCDGVNHNEIVKYLCKQQVPFMITFRKFNVNFRSQSYESDKEEAELQSIVGGSMKNFVSLNSVFDSWIKIIEKRNKETMINESLAAIGGKNSSNCVERIAFILSYYKKWIYDKENAMKRDDVYGISMHSFINKLRFYDIAQLLNDYKYIIDNALYLSYKVGVVNDNEKCLMFQRNQRDRSQDIDYNEMYFLDINERDLDINEICVEQHLDKIYSYLMCCTYLYCNNNIDKYRNENRKRNENYNKYITKINPNHNKEEEELKEESVYKIYNGYQFGHRFHYWNYYKSFNEDWSFFVEAKYQDLKQEILNIMNMKLSLWNIVYQKGEELKSMIHCREILRARKGFNCDYEIEESSCIHLNHIMSLLFYCNFDFLRDALKSSYFKHDANQTYDALKEGHRSYANLGKLLVECVHVFGDEMSKKEQYIHCVDNEILFSLFCAEFHAPTSMTSKLSVANLYANNADAELMLITGSDFSARNFDCCWISDETHESERLFIAGQYLEIRSIIDVKNNVNYQFYIDAMKIFQTLINGEYILHKISASIISILVEMINNELNPNIINNVPLFIEKVFHNYCKNIVREITLRMCYLSTKYISSSLRKYFIAHNDHMIKLDVLFGLFPSIEKLRVTYEQNQGLILNEISYEYFLNFLATYSQIENEWKFNELLIRPNDGKSKPIHQMIKKYQQQFKQYHISMKKETNVFGDDYVCFETIMKSNSASVNPYNYCTVM